MFKLASAMSPVIIRLVAVAAAVMEMVVRITPTAAPVIVQPGANTQFQILCVRRKYMTT
jgi:hypothetical protein